MKSMTGYARIEGRIGDRLCVVEIKTVNHRFLDISLKIPRSFTPLELTIKKYLSTKVNRGRIDASIQMENGGDDNFRIGLNFSLAQEYYGFLTKLKNELKLTEEISLSHFLSLQDIISVEKVEKEFQGWDVLRVLLDEALNALNKMREAEGEILKQDLQKRMDNISRSLSEIESYASQITNFYREKLLKRFQGLDLSFEVDEPRLLTEIFFLSERADITEEIIRIKSHLKQFQGLLEVPNALGRKLDFTLQEINREVNTMSSKANDIKVSQAVVEIKSDLEKMREQVQNVE